MALSNLRLVGPSVSDSDRTSIAASPALATGSLASNLQSPLRSRVARTTSIGTQTFTGNWSTAPSIKAVAIGRHNLDSDCRWKIELFSGLGQTGTLQYTSGDLNPISASGWDENTSVTWLTAAVTPLSFRLTISSTLAGHPADGYFEIGRLFMGAVWEPTINVPHGGFVSAWQEEARQVRTGAGSIRSQYGPNYRTLEARLEWLTESERAALWGILRDAGLRKDFLVSALPGGDSVQDRDHLMFCKVAEMPDFSFPLPSYWSSRLRLSET